VTGLCGLLLFVANGWAQDTVVLANRDLAPGDRIEEGVMYTQRVDDDSEFKFAFNDPKELIGRQVKTRILADEIIHKSRLLDAGSRRSEDEIPSGMRAMAIPVSKGVSKSLEAGDRVDLLLSKPDGGACAWALSASLQVKHRNGTEETGEWITALVTPEQARMGVVARLSGTLIVSVRGQSDAPDHGGGVPQCEPKQQVELE